MLPSTTACSSGGPSIPLLASSCDKQWPNLVITTVVILPSQKPLQRPATSTNKDMQKGRTQERFPYACPTTRPLHVASFVVPDYADQHRASKAAYILLSVASAVESRISSLCSRYSSSSASTILMLFPTLRAGISPASTIR